MKKILLIALCATMGLVLKAQTPQDIVEKFDCGELVKIQATAHQDYHFVRWSDGVTDAERTIDLATDTALTAIFAHDNLQPVFTATEGGVLVDSLGNEITSYSPEVEWGHSVTVTAKVADDCYEFVGWYKGDELYSEEAMITVVPADNSELTAKFAKKQLTIQLFSSDPTMGTVMIISKVE